MESKRKIDRLVDETLESVASIDTVKTPPFFKEKVLNRMAQATKEDEKDVAIVPWFTPKLQAAALVCFVFLNAAALLTYSAEQSYNERVSSFAEVYGLSETDTDSYLYQN
jgi:hypothetical protein